MQAGFHDRSRVVYRFKGPGGDKGVELVICKCKDIRTVFQICHQCIRAVALALWRVGDIKIRLPAVFVLKSGDDLAKQRLVFRRAPDCQMDGVRDGGERLGLCCGRRCFALASRQDKWYQKK